MQILGSVCLDKQRNKKRIFPLPEESRDSNPGRGDRWILDLRHNLPHKDDSKIHMPNLGF